MGGMGATPTWAASPHNETRFGERSRDAELEASQRSKRRIALGWLCGLQAGATLAPGAVTFFYKPHDWSVVAGTAALDPGGEMAALAFQLAVIFASVLIVILFAGFSAPVRFGVLIFLAIPVIDIFHRVVNEITVANQLFSLAYLCIVALAVISLRPGIEDLQIIGMIGAGFAAVSLTYAMLRPENAFMPDNWNEKLISSFPALAGPFYHSNTLGLFLALCLPFTLLIKHRVVRAVSALLITGAVVLSQSRTALFAIGLALLILIICRLRSGMTRFVAGFSLFAAGGIVCIIPLLTEDKSEFSNRAMVWNWAFHQMQTLDHCLWGVRAVWPVSRSEGALASSAHNLFVQWMYIGGISLVAVGVALFISYARQAFQLVTENEKLACLLYIILLAMLSTFEFLLLLSPSSPFFLVIVVPMVCVLNNCLDRLPRQGQII